MTTYVDSSALVAVYVPETFSSAARAAVRGAGQLPFTALHRLEIPNAFELLVGRRLLTRDESRTVRQQLQDDIESQRLLSIAIDLGHVFDMAVDLSREYTAKLLTRSLDLLHVAAAHTLECARFVSADDRQLAAAKASGLTIVDIKRGRRSKG